MFSSIPKTNLKFSVTLDQSKFQALADESASAWNLDWSKIFLFGKELNHMTDVNIFKKWKKNFF